VKIHYDIESIPALNITAVTTGTFDGVHLGHKIIIERLIAAARTIGGESVLLTFYPHPRIVLFPDDNQIKMLNTPIEKENLLQASGIDHLVVIPFTKEFSRLSSLEFVRNILSNTLKAKKLVIGYDHHFGRNREGSFAHLLEFGSLYGFQVEEIPAQDIDHVAISSSKIRQALASGDLNTANSYLGYEYNITGKVIKGKQLGRTIGYPTANIEIKQLRSIFLILISKFIINRLLFIFIKNCVMRKSMIQLINLNHNWLLTKKMLSNTSYK